MCWHCESNLSKDEGFFIQAIISKHMTSDQVIEILKSKYRSIYNLEQYTDYIKSVEKELYNG